MKKLMITAAALAACIGLQADIESVNVVGYENTAMRKDFTLWTPMFGDVAQQTMNIQSLTPQGEEVPDAGEIALQTLNAAGLQGDVFLTWWGDAWYDTDDNTPDVTLERGDAIWISFPNDSLSLSCAGEVKNQTVVTPLVEGFVALGNPFPVKVDIQTVIPVASEGEVPESGEIAIQTLDSAGMQGEVFLTWWGDGWYNTDDEMPATILAPGEGIWVNSPSSNISLRWPGFSL